MNCVVRWLPELVWEARGASKRLCSTWRAETHFYHAHLFLVSSLLADEIIRLYIAFTCTFPQLCCSDLTCFFSTYLPLHPPPTGYQSVTFFAHLLQLCRLALLCMEKQTGSFPLCLSTPYAQHQHGALSNYITIATGLRCLSDLLFQQKHSILYKRFSAGCINLFHLTLLPVLLLKKKIISELENQ